MEKHETKQSRKSSDPMETESVEKPISGSLALPLSSTILSVIERFPENEDISALQIALEILKRHPEYGGRGQHAQ